MQENLLLHCRKRLPFPLRTPKLRQSPSYMGDPLRFLRDTLPS